MSSYHYRGKRQFRRSPLSDLIFASLALLLVVILVAVFLRLNADKPGAGQPGSDDPPSPAVTDSEPPSPSPLTPADIPWNLTLVNANHPLPEDFSIETATLTNGKAYDARAIDALNEFLTACRNEGLQPLVCSAYRTVEGQTTLFQNKIDKYLANGMTYDEAYAATAVEIAVPGTSEHNLGLAADICALSYQNLDDAQADTAEQKWLMAHCAEYGFILRYPKDKENITGIIYEPWHYRYVGKEAAKAIMDAGLCLEEYMSQQYGLD